MITPKLKDVLSCDELDNVCLNEKVFQHFPVTVVEFDELILGSLLMMSGCILFCGGKQFVKL